MIEIVYRGKQFRQLIQLLESSQIQYSRRLQLSELEASLQAVQVIAGSGGLSWIAKCLVDWVKSRNSASIYYKDGDKEVKIENLSQQDIQKIMEKGLPLLLTDPEDSEES